jgi:hypothetical protein
MIQNQLNDDIVEKSLKILEDKNTSFPATVLLN